MTVEEIKTVLNEKCNEQWENIKVMENYYGQTSVRAQKALTRWVSFDDLFRELFKEEPLYNLFV